VNGPIASPLGCIACSNGQLIFMVDEETDRRFLECEECMTGFWDTLGPGEPFRTEDRVARVRLASPAAIRDRHRGGVSADSETASTHRRVER
jgi:hypothetical protein